MRPGDVIADRFEVVSLASAGGMGTVYSALDRQTGVRAALKMLQSCGEQYARLFDREARVLAELSHPAIVRYIAHGSTAEGDMYLAMEWLEGEDLAERLANGPLAVDEGILLGLKASDAMAAAHARSIVHRDIKPSNLFLREREVEHVKLLDFGVARSRGGTRPATLTGVIVGTPGYIAPEQALGAKELDPRVDVFSLGCVLFECFAGRPAFEGEHVMVLLSRILLGDAPRLRTHVAGIPEELDELVAKMLAKDPKERPADGAEVHARVAAIAARYAAQPRASSVAQAPPRRAVEADTWPAMLPKPAAAPPADPEEEDSTIEASAAELPPEIVPTLLGEPGVFVARERELAAIEAAMEHAFSSRSPRALLVTGASGGGKSRLRAEVLRRLRSREESVAVWSARGDTIGADSPFRGLSALLWRGLGLPPRGAASPRKPRLERRVATAVKRLAAEHDVRRIAEFIGEIVGISFGRDGVALRAARQDALLMGDQMKRAFEDWTSLVAAERPLLIVLDDLQWLDRATIAFLELALRSIKDRPVFVLAFAQPDVHTRFPSLWGGAATELALSRLSYDESLQLIRSALRLDTSPSAPRRARHFAKWGTTVTPDDIDAIALGAGGNPHRIEEMLRAMAFGVGDPMDGEVRVRVEALPDEPRRRLSAASVFGLSFSEDELSAVVKDATDTIELTAWVGARQWLLELGRQELLLALGPTLSKEHAFRHPAVRDAAYALLSEEDRVFYHRRAAEYLERVGHAEPGVLAHHFEQGGEPRRAAGYAVLGAERALAAHDHAAVLAWVERGIRDGAEGELYGTLMLLATEAHKWLGDNRRALESAEEALTALPRGSSLWYGAIAEVALAAGNLAALDRLDLVYELLRAVRQEGELGSALVIAEARVALQLLYAGRHDLGEALLAPAERELTLYAQRDPEVMASVHRVRAFRAMFAGDPGTSVAEFHAATQAFEAVGDLRNACVQQVNMGYATIELGAYDQAEHALRSALATAERLGLDNLTTFARHNLGLALARQGQLYEARTIETQALDAFVRQGLRRLEGGSRIYLAMILALGGDNAGAEAQAQLAVEVLSGHPPARAQALATLARILVLAGRLDEAVAPATEAMELLEALGGIEEGESLVRLEHAVAINAVGGRFAARRAILAARDRLLARAEKIQDPAWRQSFLTRVPENARTLTLARSWAPHSRPYE
jgi:tetratricopeptide (TPR) repeat protein